MLATALALLSGRLQLPVAFGVDLLLTPGNKSLRGNTECFVAQPERGNRIFGGSIARMPGMQGSQQDIAVN
jgi:hypothetical protein